MSYKSSVWLAFFGTYKQVSMCIKDINIYFELTLALKLTSSQKKTQNTAHFCALI